LSLEVANSFPQYKTPQSGYYGKEIQRMANISFWLGDKAPLCRHAFLSMRSGFGER